MLIAAFQLPNLPSSKLHRKSVLDTWLKMDWLGMFLMTLALFLLLTGLQWGGGVKPWDDPGVLATLITVSIHTPSSLFFPLKYAGRV